MHNRGQGIAIDLFLGVAIFLLLLTAVLAIWSNTETTASKELTENEMQQMAEKALDRLIRSKGDPENWETLTPNDPAIITVGLAKADRVLDKEKVNQFVSGKANLSPLALWHLDGDATDSSGNGYNGTIVGELTDSTDCPSGKCLHFNGTTDYVRIADNPVFKSFTKSNGITFTAWINPDNFNNSYNMFMGHYVPYFNVRGDSPYSGKLHFSIYATNQKSAIGNTVLFTGQWYHVAATYGSDCHIRIFLNGKEELYSMNECAKDCADPTNTCVEIDNKDSDQMIGYWRGNLPAPDNYFFGGYIDEVAIYNRALSADEIKALYRGLSFDKTKLLIGNYDYYFRLVDPKTKETIRNEAGKPVQVGLDPDDKSPTAPFNREEREKFIKTKIARAVTFKYKRWEQNQPIEEEAKEHAAIAELVLYRAR
jgi:hypothetical protein